MGIRLQQSIITTAVDLLELNVFEFHFSLNFIFYNIYVKKTALIVKMRIVSTAIDTAKINTISKELYK